LAFFFGLFVRLFVSGANFLHKGARLLRGGWLDVRSIFAQAVAHHQAGRLDAAIAGYRQVLVLRPDLAAAHNNLGSALCDEGKLEEAEASYRRALALEPGQSEGHNNLGTVLFERDRLDEAAACYAQALALTPDYAEAHHNLGAVYDRQGKLDEAESSIRKALVLKPGYAEAHDSLGTVLWEQGKLAEALASTRRALAVVPDFPRALNNLGGMLRDLGRLDEALSVYRRLLQIRPRDTDALNGLAAVLTAKGDTALALETILRSLQIRETIRARWIFVDIAKSLRWTGGNPQIRGAMVRALMEPWDRPCDLAHTSASLIKQNPKTGAMVARAAQAWPQSLPASELFGPDGVAALAKDELLCALLVSANAADIALERFLTMARRLLLEAGANNDGEGLAFHAALARQCFLNDYVFFHDEEEIRRAAQLRDALALEIAAGAQVSALRLLAVAAYFPLHSVSGAARLLDMPWPEEVDAVLTQQIREPEEEARLRAATPRVTRIDDALSRQVQNQYEENPYPRWVRIPKAEKANSVSKYLSQKFPFAVFERQSCGETAEIFSACCGAGQMMLELAQSLKGRVAAVDLSLTSLGYARRKALELGRSDIEFAQADVLELGTIGKSFDVIECSGALHYLADPFAGWGVLLSLLRPGGYMTLSLYSEPARRRIVAARQRIAAWGYGASAGDIRRCRQDLWDADKPDLRIVNAYDFYGVSTCRDLLFHVQEWQTDLIAIAAFLKDNGLTFLGFETDRATLQAYRRRFPGDPAATDLRNWHSFEKDNPDTFSRMYQFWIQKRP
jgi:tetratricopeptide (TPR) repeat protein/2-polyprenyl-3-methyl-5-hydroxy-6-metoxy-1,4-benzoquinol methylase